MDNNVNVELLNQIIWNERNAAAAAAAANENFGNGILDEEDDDDDDDEEDGDDREGGDGTLDGGVARGSDGVDPATSNAERKSSSDCDLVFYFECEEYLDIAPEHPILRPGVVVSVGLDKSTKLLAVFQRYVEFCNEATRSSSSSASKKNRDRSKIDVSDLEFLHCQLLNGSDTAESSALMKNDRIKVRKVRTAEREAEQEHKRMQRDADRNFFQQIRHLMPDMGGSKTADVILDCQGRLSDESGRNQQVLSSTVKAHSVILKKRCPWLEGMIRTAEIEATREAQMEARALDRAHEVAPKDHYPSNMVRRVESDVKSGDEVGNEVNDDDDDDNSAIVSFSPKEKPEMEEASGAAEIEIDDEDDDASYDGSTTHQLAPVEERPISPRAVAPRKVVPREGKKLLRITLNHSPEAVKLLLEYCYSNRVASLGQEAFVQACKTRPQKHSGPIAPYPISASGSRRWPQSGNPTVAFGVAVAGVVLAEEAGLPRLSVMCEIAASQLLTSSNVVDALSLCNNQKSASGNGLAILRKAAMAVIFRNGSRGVSDLGRSQSFRRGLDARRGAIVPTLLEGTLEAVDAQEKKGLMKRDRHDMAMLSFEVLDSEDKYRRERERKKRRLERIESDPNRRHELVDFEMEEIYDEFRGWAHEAPKRSLRRMAKHLENMTNRSMAAFNSRHRYAFPTGGVGASASNNPTSTRRASGGGGGSSSRRRSSTNQP